MMGPMTVKNSILCDQREETTRRFRETGGRRSPGDLAFKLVTATRSEALQQHRWIQVTSLYIGTCCMTMVAVGSHETLQYFRTKVQKSSVPRILRTRVGPLETRCLIFGFSNSIGQVFHVCDAIPSGSGVLKRWSLLDRQAYCYCWTEYCDTKMMPDQCA